MAEKEVNLGNLTASQSQQHRETSLPFRIYKQVSEEQRKLLAPTTFFPFTQFAAKQTKNTTVLWKINQM